MVVRHGFEMWAVFSDGALVSRSERWSQGEAERLAGKLVTDITDTHLFGVPYTVPGK